MKIFGWKKQIANLVCKIFGHRESVIWNMDKLTGRFCTRCKTWTSSKHS